MAHFMLPQAMASAQWELTKGALRANVALLGSYSTGLPREEMPFEALHKKVEAFIKEVEDDELICIGD